MVTTENPRPIETTVTVLTEELVLPLVGETPYQEAFLADLTELKLEKGEEASLETVLKKFTEAGLNYPELAFYAKNIGMIEEIYQNEWIGITADDVAARDPFEGNVQAKLKEAGVEKALVFWVAKNSSEK